MRTRTIPCFTVIVMTAIFVIQLGNRAMGQDLRGDVAKGRSLAQSWCSSCHQIEATAPPVGDRFSDFPAIANSTSTTALSLNVFFQTSHSNMPNIQLSRDETDNIIAFILGQKIQ